MEFIKESEIAEIIYGSMIRDITADERRKLTEWIADAEENRALYDRIVNGESFGEQQAVRKLFAEDSGLEKIGRRIRGRFIRRISVAAAAAASIAAACVMILRTPGGGESGFPDFATLEMREPGKPQAILTYENTRVALTETEQGSQWEKYVGEAAAEDPATSGKVRINVPRGGEYRLELADGSVVWLNSESTLEYPKTFSGAERTVRLEGEAFFEVARDGAKPFFVEFGDARAKVLGTSFNISAYPGDAASTATLLSGKIEISRSGSVAELIPDRQAVVKKGAAGITVAEVDASLYSSWTKGLFMFENMRLEDICTRLARWYDVEFEFEGASGDERFTGGTWKYLPLGEFLSGIEKVTDVRFDYTGNKVKTIGKV